MAGELTTPTNLKEGQEKNDTSPVRGALDQAPPADSPPKDEGKKRRKRVKGVEDKGKKAEKPAAHGIPLARRGEGDVWEMAHVRRNAGVFRVEDTVEHPREMDNGEGAVIAIPSHLSYCVPLWLATEEQSLFPDMVRFQLEKRGLVNQNEDTEGRLHLNRVLIENGRSLVLACLLSPTFPDDLCFIDARAWELSAATYPIADNSAALWREGDRLALACRRKGSLVAIQVFNGADLDPMAASEIACVLLELLSSEIMPEINRIQLWGNFSREEQQTLADVWESEISCDDRPGMVLPAQAAPFLPPRVDWLRRRRRRGKRLFAFTAVAIGIYLVFLALFVGQFALLKWNVMQLDDALAENRETVEMIQETQQRWEVLTPSIQPDYYAVEQLLQASKPLPPEGVRFTLFQSQPNQILIRGEARAFREAQAYYQKLQQVPELEDFEWTMGSPKIEADGRASFQIEGLRENFQAPDQA